MELSSSSERQTATLSLLTLSLYPVYDRTMVSGVTVQRSAATAQSQLTSIYNYRIPPQPARCALSQGGPHSYPATHACHRATEGCCVLEDADFTSPQSLALRTLTSHRKMRAGGCGFHLSRLSLASLAITAAMARTAGSSRCSSDVASRVMPEANSSMDKRPDLSRSHRSKTA